MDLNKYLTAYKKKIHMEAWPDEILYQDIRFINGLTSYINYQLKRNYFWYKENKGE